MPLIFWIAAVAMTTAALLFVLRPVAVAGNRSLVMALAIAVPATATGLYLGLGAPTLANTVPGQEHRAMGADQRAAPNRPVGSVASLVGGLEQRLADNPDDGKGWLLLAQSYRHLQRNDDALDAYAHAVALGQHDASFEAMTKDESSGSTDSASTARIEGTISLSAAAAARVQPDDRVFVFARGAGQTGAPAAVVQLPADSWPIEYHLSDADAMVAGVSLSSFEQVVVMARVTRAGDAKNALQGLEAKSPLVAVGSGETVNLVIQ